MAKRQNDFTDVKVAVANSNTLGALVGTVVDTRTYSRARFIFSFAGGAATTAAVSGNVGVWKAATNTTGSVFSSIATAILTTISSGTISAAATVAVIDLPTDPDYPYFKVSGNISSTGLAHSAIVELYDGINR